MNNKSYFALALGLAMATSPLQAGSPSGARFLRMASPRSAALGRADATTVLGAQAALGNPAGLIGLGNKYELGNVFMGLAGGGTYGHIGAGIFVGEKTAFGGHLTRLSIGDLDGRDALGNQTSSFKTQDQAVGLSMARRLSSQLTVGGTVKSVSSQIGDFKSKAATALDLGATYKMSDRLFVGASANNLGGKIGFEGEEDPLPASLNAGASYALGRMTARLEIGQEMNEGRTTTSLGLEYPIGPLSLRGGYRMDGDKSKNLALKQAEGAAGAMEGLSMGLGFRLGERITLDYAVTQPAVEWGLTHAAAVAFRWGPEIQAPGTYLTPSTREVYYEDPEPVQVKPKPTPKKAAPAQVSPQKKATKPAPAVRQAPAKRVAPSVRKAAPAKKAPAKKRKVTLKEVW